MSWGQRRADLGLLLLRVGTGGTMFWLHGLGKLLSFQNSPIQFADPIGIGPVGSLALATFAEFFAALAIAFGVMTRWAALVLAINMSVAFFIAHHGDPMAKKELALLYLIASVTIFCTGGGRFAIENRWQR